jgi:hypothetical protein
MSGSRRLCQRVTALVGVLALALTVLSAQLLARLDRVHVHVRCDEHGDLKHAEPHAAAVETAPASTQVSSGTPVAPANHHDHCLVGDVASPLVTALHVDIAITPVDLTLRTVPAPAAPVSAVPLLRFAPKTSPPART